MSSAPTLLEESSSDTTGEPNTGLWASVALLRSLCLRPRQLVRGEWVSKKPLSRVLLYVVLAIALSARSQRATVVGFRPSAKGA